MIGGMIWPPLEAIASIDAATRESKPDDFISGMVKEPVVTTLAVVLPDNVP
jgi:hypothetical protein